VKTDISAVSPGEEKMKNELKAGIQDKISYIKELKNCINAMETKLNTGQAESEERMNCTLQQQLKGVTPQQLWEDFSCDRQVTF
jgi:hypothetical protein